jgi:hypothetical protein
MIDPAQRQHHLASATAFISDRGKSEPPRSQSFRAALSDELAKRNNIARENEALPANFALGQQNVARLDPGTASASTAPSTSNTAPPSSGLNGLVVASPNPSPGPVGTTSGTTGGTTGSLSSQTSFDDAYWASQPTAVQQLRNIQDPTQRAAVAGQLAGEGYAIDVPVMVWGWDPAITTQARESMGYTWVPSALQQPVEVAPGLTFNGTSYNPSNPPPGSIPV